jgi:hypothetical protein
MQPPIANHQKKVNSGRPAIWTGIILIVIAIALIIIAQILKSNEPNYYSRDLGYSDEQIAILKNRSKPLFQNIGLGICVLIIGSIVLVFGLLKKKSAPQVVQKSDRPTDIASTSSTSDRYAQLEKLGKLKDQGLLTEEEFQNQKDKILG